MARSEKAEAPAATGASIRELGYRRFPSITQPLPWPQAVPDMIALHLRASDLIDGGAHG